MYTRKIKLRTTLAVTMANLLVGNLIIAGGGEPLNKIAIATSIACVLFYTWLFMFTNVVKVPVAAQLAVCILSTPAVLTLGNGLLVAYMTGPALLSHAFKATAAAMVMAFFGSLLFFPVLVGMGIMNFFIVVATTKAKRSRRLSRDEY